MSMSRIVKVLLVLAVIVVLWKVFSGGSSEIDVEYDPVA